MDTYPTQLLSPLSHSTMVTETWFKKVRVLSLNLFLRPPGIKNNRSDYKDERLTYFINEILESYDIICLQEVFGTFNRRRNRLIKGALHAGYHYFAQSPAPGFWTNQLIDGGLVILSRYPIIETEFQGFYNGLGPDLFSFKGVLYTKLNVQGETIHVFSAHTQASYHTDDPRLFNYYRMVRRSQFRMMRDFIERKTQESQDLILVMGDMNVDGREKLKKPLFQETECQDDYEIMIESLSNKDNIVDLIRSKYGFSPCTFGKTLANGEPEETILSHIDENNKELALDYILAINLDKAAFGHYIEDTNTEPFYVKGKPFTRLSDHYGVQTSLYVKTELKSQ